MTLRDRIVTAENRFSTLQSERQEHLDKAQECLTEMTKLQGEWRILQELLDSEEVKQPSKPNKKTATIEAVAEE